MLECCDLVLHVFLVLGKKKVKGLLFQVLLKEVGKSQRQIMTVIFIWLSNLNDYYMGNILVMSHMGNFNYCHTE